MAKRPIRNLIAVFLKLPLRFLLAVREVRTSYKVSQSYTDSMCLFVAGNRCRFIPAKISSNMQEVQPQGLSISVENAHSLIEEPFNRNMYIIDLDNCRTINLKEKPQEDTIEKLLENYKYDEDNKKLVKTIDMKEYRINGARFLNERAYQIGRTSLLKFLEERGNRETVLIILASMAVGGFMTMVIIGVLY